MDQKEQPLCGDSQMIEPNLEITPLEEIDKVLSSESQSTDTGVDMAGPQLDAPEVSEKALTRSDLIKKVRSLYKISKKPPIIDGKECKNFARLRKSQLLLCLKFFSDQIDPTCNVNLTSNHATEKSESTPFSSSDPVHSDFVSSVLYRANLMLLSGLESVSKSERFQSMVGFCFQGMVEHIESQTSSQIALKEALFEIYCENKQLLDSIISPTSKLVLINMQIAFACARRRQIPPKSSVRLEKCNDKIPSAALRV